MNSATTELPKRQLPPELWIVIREFIEPYELVKYMGVHRVFYEHVMDLRYHELDLRDLRPSRLFKVIENLKYHDAAGRVRILTIWPIALQTAVRDVPSPQERSHSLLREIVKLLRRITSRRRIQTTSQRRDDLIRGRYRVVTDAGQGLTRVETTNLHWLGPDQFDEPLFRAIQPVFGPNLRMLFFDIPFMTFAKACAHLTDLKHLAELELNLHVDLVHMVSKKDLETAVTSSVVPFLNRLGSSLRVLSMTTKNHLELAPLFQGLKLFPKLDRLMLFIPFDRHHIDVPSGFNRFLINHPDLQELYITHKPCCKAHDDCTGAGWVEECFKDIAFTGLKTLNLGLTTALHLNHAKYMAPLAQSLSSLILTEPNLRYAEVQKVLEELTTPYIISLSLFVETLTPQILALFAEKRPELEQLELNIVECRRAEGAPGPHDEAGFLLGLEQDYVFRRQHFDAWKLRRLSIWKWVKTLGRRQQPILIDAINAKVPALRASSERRTHDPPER